MDALDMNTARRHERRDGIPCFVIHEAKPSTVAHLFHPLHPDYEAAKAIHAESQKARAEQIGFFA